MKRFKSICSLFLGLALFSAVAPSLGNAQTFADTITMLTGAQCPGSATAGTGVVYNGIPAVGTGLMVLTTPFAPVYQTQTTAGAATITNTCDIPCVGLRTTVGKGCTAVAGIGFIYGVQTTPATSENAPVCGFVTFPAPAAAETPSTVAFVNAPVTALPVIGSANLGLTTAGAFVTQYAAITTPPSLPSAAGVVYQKLFCTFSFAQAAAAAQIINTPGAIVFTTNTVSWLRKHKHGPAVDAMLHMGINKSTAELIYAHYVTDSKPVPPPKPQCDLMPCNSDGTTQTGARKSLTSASL